MSYKILIALVFIIGCNKNLSNKSSCQPESCVKKLATQKDNFDVVCFSGGKQIYYGLSIGRVLFKNDGRIEFIDKDTGLTHSIRADCWVTDFRDPVKVNE